MNEQKVETVKIDDVYKMSVEIKGQGVSLESFHWAVSEAVRQYLNGVEGKVEK